MISRTQWKILEDSRPIPYTTFTATKLHMTVFFTLSKRVDLPQAFNIIHSYKSTISHRNTISHFTQLSVTQEIRKMLCQIQMPPFTINSYLHFIDKHCINSFKSQSSGLWHCSKVVAYCFREPCCLDLHGEHSIVLWMLVLVSWPGRLMWIFIVV